jgi:hypothetical protein
MLEAYEELQKGEQDEPKWLTEGLAVYLSEYYVPQLRREGKLDRKSDRGAYDPNEIPRLGGFMMSNMYEIREFQKADPTLNPENSTDSEQPRAPYLLGAWAVQYLKHDKGIDAILNEFYPAIRSLGWEEAFSQTFGRTVDQFYIEFDRFMNQSNDDLIKFLIVEF